MTISQATNARMRLLGRVLALVAAASLFLCSCGPGEQAGTGPVAQPRAPAASRGEAAERVPGKVIAVYEQVLRTGHPPPGYVGGRVFENRERRLPPGGNYHEFDVNPKVSGRNRGAERLIVELDTGKGWYTADHYRTFVPIERSARER